MCYKFMRFIGRIEPEDAKFGSHKKTFKEDGKWKY